MHRPALHFDVHVDAAQGGYLHIAKAGVEAEEVGPGGRLQELPQVAYLARLRDLFVGGDHDGRVESPWFLPGHFQTQEQCRDSPLHVGCSATVDPSAFYSWLEGVPSLGRNDVDVRVEQ